MLDRMLCLLGLNAFQGSFESSRIFLDFIGTVREQFSIELVPALWI